jgi:hypothetical protein
MFHLPTHPESAHLHIWARSKYRLLVNDQIVGYGPSRQHAHRPCFDTWDLAQALRRGTNRIEIVVHAWRINNYQNDPAPSAAFWCEGTARSDQNAIDLSTPGDWTSLDAHAWTGLTRQFSFAVGPVEVCDLRSNQDRPGEPWAVIDVPGPARPRPVPQAVNRILPLARLGQWSLPMHERRHALLTARPDGRTPEAHDARPVRVRCGLRSPIRQSVDAGIWWGEHRLNGTIVHASRCPDRPGRQELRLDLHQGENSLESAFDELQATWFWMLALPTSAGVELTSAQLQAGPGEPWNQVRSDAVIPARELHWDTLGWEVGAEQDMLPRARTLMLDAQCEFLGHLRVEIDAPAGTIVDLAVDERLDERGVLGLYSANPFVDSADRFVCAEGANVFETFQPRGGRYVQMTIRPPDDRPTRLAFAGYRDARADTRVDASFECDDPLLDWLWSKCVETCRVNTEDSYCDAPWRERGTYLYDSYMHSRAEMAFSLDWRMSAHVVRLFADGQFGPDHPTPDLYPGCTPGWHGRPHFDFSLIFARWVRDYYAHSGDEATTRYAWPGIGRMLARAWPVSSRSILWDCPKAYRSFIDWGAQPAAAGANENACIAAYRIQALEAAIDLASWLDDGQAPRDAWRAQARAVRLAMIERLWDDQRGCFYAGTDDQGLPLDIPAPHANLLALCMDVFDHTDPRRDRLIENCVTWSKINADLARRNNPRGGFWELVFLNWAARAFDQIGRFDITEQLIRDHYQPLNDAGAWSLWECLHRGMHGLGSMSHAWVAWPVYWMAWRVLGVTPARPGRLDVMRIAPQATTIHRASGSVPHPNGLIRVAWNRESDGSIRVDASGPQGVTLIVDPGPTQTGDR